MRSKAAVGLAALCTSGLGYPSAAEAAQVPSMTVARCHCQNSPLLATSRRGGSIVAWQEGIYDALVARRIHRNGKLGRKRKLAGLTKTSSAEGAWLAAGRSGAVVAVWEDKHGGIRARRMTRHGKLGRIHQIARSLVDDGPSELDADVAVDARGDATIVWSAVSTYIGRLIPPSRNHVYARRLTARGRLGRTIVLPVDPGFNGFPRVAYTRPGRAVVAWGLGRIFVATVGDDGHVVLGGDPVNEWDARPELAIDAGGNATVVWTHYARVGGGDQLDVMGRRLDAGGRALGPLHVISSQTRPAGVYRLAVDRAGNATVVWRDSTDDVVALRQIHADDTLGPVADLSAPGVRNNLLLGARMENAAPAVAVDRAGNAAAAWMRFAAHTNGLTYRVEARRVAANGQLGNVQTLTDASAYASDPKIISDATGTTIVAWSSRKRRSDDDEMKLARLDGSN